MIKLFQTQVSLRIAMKTFDAFCERLDFSAADSTILLSFSVFKGN